MHTHATSTKRVGNAVWGPVYEHKGKYTTQRPRGRAAGGKNTRVYDYIPAEAGDGLILCQVHLKKGVLDQKSARMLKGMTLQHHLIGDTWP